MKTIIFAFGRMNPPTKGHERLVKQIQSTAKKLKGNVESAIYLTHTQDKKKNPLSYDDKIRFATKAFGSIVKKSNAKTIIDVFQELERKGYKRVYLLIGSDRVDGFRKMIDNYAEKEFPGIDEVEVLSIKRDPDAEGATGLSATKVRQMVKDDKLDSFLDSVPLSTQDAVDLWKTLKK